MITDELKTLLLEKRLDLVKELNAIDVLLGFDNIKASEQNSSLKVETNIFPSAVNDNSKNIKSKTDVETWKDYIFYVMKSIGGKLKSKDIAEVIFSSNSNITKERVYSVTRDKLAELVKEEKITVEVGLSRKVGNIYELIDIL
jgi:hypothetical protein